MTTVCLDSQWLNIEKEEFLGYWWEHLRRMPGSLESTVVELCTSAQLTDREIVRSFRSTRMAPPPPEMARRPTTRVDNGLDLWSPALERTELFWPALPATFGTRAIYCEENLSVHVTLQRITLQRFSNTLLAKQGNGVIIDKDHAKQVSELPLIRLEISYSLELSDPGTGKVKPFSFNTKQLRNQISTEEGSPNDDDSYLGYSVATGEFTGDNVLDVAVGMPRGANLTGKV